MRLTASALLRSLLVCWLFCLFVGGCQTKSKLTKENMDRIKNGMTEQEVFDILGKGKAVTTADDFSSAPGRIRDNAERLVGSGGKFYQWKNDRTHLLVRFADGKVQGMLSATYDSR